MTAPICQGCDAEHPTKPYRITFHNGNRERVDYCAECAELARVDWNGETARIDPIEVDRP